MAKGQCQQGMLNPLGTIWSEASVLPALMGAESSPSACSGSLGRVTPAAPMCSDTFTSTHVSTSPGQQSRAVSPSPNTLCLAKLPT